jgi:predicted nicotinamide N-methyase
MSAEIPPSVGHRFETPWEALGPIVRDTVIVEGRSFYLSRPDESDRLLNHPAIRSAFAADEYLPYWADLWPASRMLAKTILREPWPKTEPPLHALEIGCGLGLPGIVALSVGLRVTFSDYDKTALKFAAQNAQQNGFTDFQLLQLDWRDPPADLKVPVILAADLIYELRSVPPLVALIKRLLTPDGVCLLTDADRVPSHSLRETLPTEGLTFTAQQMKAGEPGGRRIKGTLYRIRHAAGS